MTLIITASAQEYGRMRRILSRSTCNQNQVLIEATIAEVGLERSIVHGPALVPAGGQLSVQVHRYRRDHPTTPRPTSPPPSPPLPRRRSQDFPASSTLSTSRSYSMRWSTITDVNIISSPTLMVLDNKRATLQVGDGVPIVTQSAVAVQVPGAPIVNSVNMRSTGIILNITPRINDGGRVVLDIEQEVSTAVQTTTSGIVSPTIQQRRIKTTVSVDDGNCIDASAA